MGIGKPLSINAITASSALAAVLVGGGVGATFFAVTDAPVQQDYAITAPVNQGIAHVEVHDPQEVLSAADKDRMLRDAQRISAPDTVQQLHYLVFKENRSNVNDTVEEYLRDNRPELIGEKHFADGVLIVGVGLDPRQAFVFAGEDVASLLDLRKSDHLDDSLNAIKPGVKADNIPAGLFAGATEATNVEKLAQERYNDAVDSRSLGGLASGFASGGAAAAGVALYGARRRKQAQTLAQAREDLAFVGKEYGELGQRLDGIDIRANSLTSPLAHREMRAQWAEVRDRFLNLHDQVDRFGGLTNSDDPKRILANAKEISEAAKVARQVSYAEDNIDVLFRLEHGDEVLRRREVNELRKDIVAAQGAVPSTSSGLYATLSNARLTAERLEQQTHTPDFLERYAMLLSDYQQALTTLKEQKFSDVKDQSSKPTVPTIYEAGYRPGYGYVDFIPFWAMQSWHSDAIAAQQAAESSSSTNTSFSSGFSGSGGSSSF